MLFVEIAVTHFVDAEKNAVLVVPPRSKSTSQATNVKNGHGNCLAKPLSSTRKLSAGCTYWTTIVFIKKHTMLH